jgi:hypothetical protein
MIGDSSLRASLDRHRLLGIEPVVDPISPMLHQLRARAEKRERFNFPMPTKMPTNWTDGANFYQCFQRGSKIFPKIWNQTNGLSYCFYWYFPPGALGR